MKPITKAATIIIAIAIVSVYFFVPVVFWMSSGAPAKSVPVYRSLGCATLGLGDLYAPGLFGFNFGCQIPSKYIHP